jgi:N,N'-diacetylbacillosaminyl-diphospho-undecaprenol alpha-1,3-N-acetylgalactosaminyltransferase
MKGKKIAYFSHLDANLYRFRLPVMKRLVSEGAHVYAIAPQGRIARRFQDHGVEFVPFEINRKTFNPLMSLSTINKLSAVLKELHPDLLHTFTLRPNVYGALAGKRAVVPAIICTVTGLGSLYVEGVGFKGVAARLVVNLATRFALREASAVIFQNPDDRRYYLGHRLCRSDQAHLVISSGVDPKDFSPDKVCQEAKAHLRQQWNITSDDIVVTMIARLIVPKGVGEFLRAAGELKDRARFVLIGEPDPGNPSSLSWKELSEYTQRGIALAPGRQENILEWLAVSDIYVLPSYREGVPRTVLEAMAMKLPVITTDAPGCRETVIEGQNGFLVPPRSSQALVQALNSLIDSAELRKRMGTRSRELVVERFSSKKITDQYFSLYNQVLSKKGICT